MVFGRGDSGNWGRYPSLSVGDEGRVRRFESAAAASRVSRDALAPVEDRLYRPSGALESGRFGRGVYHPAMTADDQPNAHCCEHMQFHLAGGEIGLIYTPTFREYSLEYRDGGTSFQLLAFCPWCGRRLPESLRDRWFELLQARGLEPEDPDIPQEFRTDQWWIARGLGRTE